MKDTLFLIYNDLIKEKTKKERLVLMLSLSVFLPYVFTAIALIIACVFAFLDKDFAKGFLEKSEGKLVLMFFLLNAITPFLFKNYLGALCFLGILIMLVLALYIRDIMTQKLYDAVYKVLCFGSFLASFVAVFQKIIGLTNNEGRVASVCFNANYYGTLIEIMVILIIYRIFYQKKDIILSVCALILNAMGLILCNCQSAFIGIAFGLWLLLLFTKKYKAFFSLTAVLILAVCFIDKLTFILPRILGFAENLKRRAGIWTASLKEIKNNFVLGRGMLGYLQYYKEYSAPSAPHCHNLVLDLLSSFGIVGTLPFVAFVIKAISKFKNSVYKSVFVCVFLALMLHSLVDVTLMWLQTGLLTVLLLSLCNIKKGEIKNA